MHQHLCLYFHPWFCKTYWYFCCPSCTRRFSSSIRSIISFLQITSPGFSVTSRSPRFRLKGREIISREDNETDLAKLQQVYIEHELHEHVNILRKKYILVCTCTYTLAKCDTLVNSSAQIIGCTLSQFNRIVLLCSIHIQWKF